MERIFNSCSDPALAVYRQAGIRVESVSERAELMLLALWAARGAILSTIPPSKAELGLAVAEGVRKGVIFTMHRLLKIEATDGARLVDSMAEQYGAVEDSGLDLEAELAEIGVQFSRRFKGEIASDIASFGRAQYTAMYAGLREYLIDTHSRFNLTA